MADQVILAAIAGAHGIGGEVRLKLFAEGLDSLFGQSWIGAAQQLEREPENWLRPGTYLAVTDELPFLEPGLQATQSRTVRSLVYGILKEAP